MSRLVLLLLAVLGVSLLLAESDESRRAPCVLASVSCDLLRFNVLSAAKRRELRSCDVAVGDLALRSCPCGLASCSCLAARTCSWDCAGVADP